ncbi:MAG: pyridine nucleotide-disulfide oxidoreductase, partial [Dehalococcoidia bacterium]|nr:pyridine nucleotide-disulfide oxidoreductase [Dehalococcoidia bacterium]
NELSLMAGVKLDPITGGSVVDELRQTSVPGIFAGGNVVHVHDLVDNVTWESELAGASAVAFANGVKSDVSDITMVAGENIRYVVPHKISGKHDVTLYMRVSEPAELVRFKVGDIMEKAERVVKPSSMIKLKVSSEQLAKLKNGNKELKVDCERRVKKNG